MLESLIVIFFFFFFFCGGTIGMISIKGTLNIDTGMYVMKDGFMHILIAN